MKTSLIKKLFLIIIEMRKAGCNVFIVALRFLYYRVFFDKNIIAHQRAKIIGVENIEMEKSSILWIGVHFRGFLSRSDVTVINIRGKLKLEKITKIGRGARIDVDSDGFMEMKDKSSINSFTKIICAKEIRIGKGTGIGWDCSILDCDFHELEFGHCKFPSSLPVRIGDHVLISHNVIIDKNVSIADGCIVSSGIKLSGRNINTANTLLSLKDGKIIQIRNVHWDD